MIETFLSLEYGVQICVVICAAVVGVAVCELLKVVIRGYAYDKVTITRRDDEDK